MATLTHWFEALWQDFQVWEKLRDPWIWFGLGAQALFFGRFIWQWIVSERRGTARSPSLSGICRSPAAGLSSSMPGISAT